MTQNLTVHVTEDGARIDRHLAAQLPELSRSLIHKLLRAQRVWVNGAEVKPSYQVQAGDVITLEVPQPEQPVATPEDIALNIVFENADLLVVDKPAGMVVHPSPGHYSGTLVNAVLAHCPDLPGIGGELRPGIVHRLDKDTSGLIIVAKNDASYAHLQRQFKERQVHKLYVALVEGIINTSRGIIDAAVGRDPSQRKKMAVVQRGGRDARTEFVVRERFALHTLVDAMPLTGRTHQIRIHFASIGHPLVGDSVYGFRKQRLALRRHFLHAAQLEFILPGTSETLTLRSELPVELQAVLDELRAG